MFRKIAIACLSVMCVCAVSLSTGCMIARNSGNSSSSSETELGQDANISQPTLSLNAYSITMRVGETYALTPTKTGVDGKEQPIGRLSCEIEEEGLLSSEENVLTALAQGETYVYVTADDMEVACFVTVEPNNAEDGLEIRFIEDSLYVGVPTSANVYATVGGSTECLTDVSWTVDENLSIDEYGEITPKNEAASAKVTATGTYNGEAYTIERTVKVVMPVNYAFSRSQVKVAALKTYSGETNAKCLRNSFCIYEYNPVTQLQTKLESDTFEIKTESDDFTLTTATDGMITVNSASETFAQTYVYIVENNSQRRMRVKVSVANAISTIDDLDRLALAPLVSPDDLSASYVMTNDIDYAGEALYQIAPWQENVSSYRAGIYWKYLLDKTNEGYALVDRANVGKEGYGLTDEEFLTFANEKGVNPLNKPFSGTFDGNGYAIKNAKLMHAAYFLAEEYEYSGGINMFGYTVGAAIVNTSFDFSVQTPEETPEGVNLHRLLIGGALVDKELKRQNGRWLFSGASLIYRAKTTTIENVYIDLDLNLKCQANRSAGGLIGWATDCVMRNNVVNLVNNARYTKYTFSLRGAGNAGVEVNNLGLGTQNGMVWDGWRPGGQIFFADYNGQDGNWFTLYNEWSMLLLAIRGNSSTNIVELQDVIASFDPSVWDMSKFNMTDVGAPILRNGCSIPLS